MVRLPCPNLSVAKTVVGPVEPIATILAIGLRRAVCVELIHKECGQE
jgi:hypothetical protein